MSKVGFIGVGTMGCPMASNIISKGNDLKFYDPYVHDENKSKLINLGAKNVLIKGGHLKSEILCDVFVNRTEIAIFKNKKIKTRNTHGTGCTLSSAIASYYSCGKTLKKSCEMAIKYVNHAIGTGPKYGKGYGPINHLNTIKVNKRFK